MCLITNWSFPRLSLKPILCYKIVRVVEHNKLVGIHQKDYKYNTNKLNKCSLFPIRGKIVHNNLLYRQVIEGGYFHFMDSLFSIKSHLYFFAHNDKSIVIKKCIIPRFTLYYKGCWDNDIAAKRFKFIN